MSLVDYGFNRSLYKETESSQQVNDVFNQTVTDSDLQTGQTYIPHIIAGQKIITVSVGGNIQDAIEQIDRDGGGIVQLQNGIHKPNNNLTMHDNVYLSGQNAESTIIDFASQAYGICILGSNNYSTGTVSVTNNSQTIEGSGTTWTSAMVGRKIMLNGLWYAISAFTDADTITIAAPYGGVTLSGATYMIATTIEDVKVSDLSVKGSAGSAITVLYGNEYWSRDVRIQTSVIGLNQDYCSNTTAIALDFVACYSALDFDNVHYTVINESGSLDALTGDGFNLNACTNSSINSCFILNSAANGISFTDCDSIAVNSGVAVENGGKGMELVSGNSSIISTTFKAKNNASDGIKLTATSDECEFIGCRAEANGGYGINIAAATDNNNTITSNILKNNVSGAFNDSGTDTEIGHNQEIEI